MRIIAGSARGRRIKAPEGQSTRPTLDRVKESLFGTIQFELGNALCLDLFAGSGNLGLEAISRGARHTFFVDHDRKCAKLIEENAKTLGFDCVTVICSDAFRALERFSKEGIRFNIVFLDPPYAKGYLPDAIEGILSLGLLADSGIIIAEHSCENDIGTYEALDVQAEKKFGDIMLTIMRKRGKRDE